MDDWRKYVAGSLVTAAAWMVTKVTAAWNRYRLMSRAQQFVEYGKLIDRQEKTIALMGAQIQQLQGAMTTMQEAHARCREETAEMRMQVAFLIDRDRRHTAVLLKAGIPVDPLPEWPPPSRAADDTDFLARTQTQNTLLVTSLEALPPPPAAPPGGAAGS